MKELTKFNQEIQVTVSVDTIAERLLSMMDPQNPHAALMVNTIIGQAVDNQRESDLSKIYNASLGAEMNLNFKPGQVLYCSQKLWDYMDSDKEQFREIGSCIVREIKSLKDCSPILIEHEHHKKGGEIIMQKTWVSVESLREPVNSN